MYMKCIAFPFLLCMSHKTIEINKPEIRDKASDREDISSVSYDEEEEDGEVPKELLKEVLKEVKIKTVVTNERMMEKCIALYILLLLICYKKAYIFSIFPPLTI